jgi:dipeptidyl aminopeptidase/acylaminoacyl peptidase
MRRVVGSAAWILLTLSGQAAQERTLPVPANVTVDGVPSIPITLVEAVAPYAQFRQARMVAWHPTERRIVVATAFGNAPQLHDVKFPGGARRQFTFFSDGVAPRPGAVFGPRGDFVLFQKDTARGGEANQLLRFDFASGAMTTLTDGKSRNGVPVSSRRGVIAYDSTQRDGKNRDLYVLNPIDPGATRMVLQAEGAWSALDWSPDEKAILALQILSSSESHLWRVDVADGAKTLLTPREERPARWSSAEFGADGESVYALSNFRGETARIWRLSRGTWTALTPDAQVIESFALSSDGGTMAAVIDAGSTTRLQLMDADGTAKRTPSLPPGVISDLVWHPALGEVAFSLAGARSFNDVYSVDAAGARAERWTMSEMGGALPETLPDAEIVKWSSFDGLEISGVLYRPAARFEGPRPVIINVHGGPVDRERPRAIGRSNYFRNELGIAVIYPNIRGSSGFGRSFEELDNGRLRENAVEDIGALLDAIAADPRLDETRVMIAGASYGGYVALASAIAYGDRLRGVNPAFAITDFPTFLESTEISRQANRNAEYGDPADPGMRAFLTRISPLTNVKALKLPAFIAAGAKDTRVPISQAEVLVKALKANGTPVWYVRFEDAGHLQLTVATSDFSIYTWVMFVQQYLLK